MRPATWTACMALALTACTALPARDAQAPGTTEQAITGPVPPTSTALPVPPTSTALPVPRPSPAARSSPAARTGPKVVARGDGRLRVVPGTGRRAGTGPVRTYLVEVEGGLGVDVAAFAREVEQTLADRRSWTGDGKRAMQRVDGRADVRIALASPVTVDRLCAPLRTDGRYSCAVGDRAVLNAGRWLTGATAYEGRLSDYRDYLVNHEVGHVLGAGHTDCPGAGRVAPVMLQQTLGLDGCVPGPWPHP